MSEPSIRFPQFTDDYEEAAFSEYVFENKSRNKFRKYDKNDVKSVSNEFGIVNQIEFFGKSMAGADVSNYHVVDTNDIVYTKSPLKSNPFGIIKHNAGSSGIVSTLYAVYKCKDNVVPAYIDYYFGYDRRLNQYLKPLVNIGAKRDMKVKNEDAISGIVCFPSLDEQKKVVECLDEYEKRIVNQRSKVKTLEKRREILLSQVFSQQVRMKSNNKTVFPDWEQCTVLDLFDKIRLTNKDGRIKNVVTNSAEYGLIPQRDFFEKDIAVEGNTQKYTVIEKGDFVYNPRKSSIAPYGPFNCYSLDEIGIVSPLYSCLKPKYPEYTPYLLWYFRSSSWHAYVNENGNQGGARHDRVGMTDKLLFGIPVLLPCEDERKKITDFFNLIEHQLCMEKSKLDKMKLVKRGLLQQMFV